MTFRTIIFNPTPPLLDWVCNPNVNVLSPATLWPYKSKESHMRFKCQNAFLRHSSKPHIEMILIQTTSIWKIKTVRLPLQKEEQQNLTAATSELCFDVKVVPKDPAVQLWEEPSERLRELYRDDKPPNYDGGIWLFGTQSIWCLINPKFCFSGSKLDHVLGFEESRNT